MKEVLRKGWSSAKRPQRVKRYYLKLRQTVFFQYKPNNKNVGGERPMLEFISGFILGSIFGFCICAILAAGKAEDERLEFMAEIEKARSERN
mgnify:CR=1 FL=1